VVGTVFEVEREARWRVWALFALLFGMVYGCIWIVTMIVEGIAELSLLAGAPRHRLLYFTLSPRGAALTFLLSLVVAVFYWFVARIGARDHLIRVMHAQPLDPHDQFHQRLANIVEEMRLATGAPRVRCLTVPTVGMNAFAFSDLHGSACIGVTEGALSRLSRPQLEAVVAHEFGHVLSGDYVTATAACLLFGVYTSLGDALNVATASDADPRGAPLLAGALAMRGLLGLLQVGSAVTNAAISRQREWAADLAAVRYTRDPLSLAQALHMMTRHPGGTGYIPSGLSALCIRPTDLHPSGLMARVMATHPPVDDRIVRLLNVAHVGWDQFSAQAAEAEKTFDEREHVATAPVAAPSAATVAAVAEHPPGASAAATVGASPSSLRAHDPLARPLVCPGCGAMLEQADYEGVPVVICRSCGGRLVATPQVLRVLTRRQMRFDERQERLADYVALHGDELRLEFARTRASRRTALIACPGCGRTMVRRHFSYEHAVEIDYCTVCDLYWFEQDELEVLQILVERMTT
jgi:Zn-dependent protease with chaperone function/Zn-finger nucleic acid-binding protein